MLNANSFRIGLLVLLVVSFNTQADNYLNNLVALIKPQHSLVAVKVINLDSGKTIYQQNANTLLLPASTQKLLTAVAATIQLGDRFSFDTKLYSRSKVRNGKLNGNLYLRFNGDPTLTSDNIRHLFKFLTLQGLHTINGNVYLVGQRNEQRRAPGLVLDDLGNCYAAPISQFIINRNCIRGKLEPIESSNQSRLTFPDYLPVTFSNDAIFDKSKRRLFCELTLQRLPGNKFHISGCRSGSRSVKLAVAISDPALYAQQMMKQLIESTHVQLKGQVLIAYKVPNSYSVVTSHKSPPLGEMLHTMLLKSDNLIADSLVKAIGQSFYHLPGSFSSGTKAVTQILTKEGIDLQYAHIVDGSGLSRYNLLTANQVAKVLVLIHQDPRFQSIATKLPVAGLSGTLHHKKFFNRPPLAKNVSAKTGTMQGVNNLAGFLSLPKHQTPLLFVLFENGRSKKASVELPSSFNALFLQGILERPSANSTE